MIINEKSLFVMACATFLFMIYAEGSAGQPKGAIDRQRWENTVDEYVQVVNEKNFVYDRTDILDLGMKSYDHGREYTCPLNPRKTCKIRKAPDGNSITVYIPGSDGMYMDTGMGYMTYIGGSDDIDLFTYYKDKNGKLRVEVESYDW